MSSPDPAWDEEASAEARAARPWQPLGAWWLGLLGLGGAGLLLVTDSLRAYGLAVGGTLAVLAVLRAVLPDRHCGGLAVRGRWVDVVTLVLLGAAIALLSTTLRLT